MKTLDFAEKHVRFDKSSPITGPFRIAYYPFLRKPFESADDIRCKRLVIYKASSCMGTVAGQIINTKRIVCEVGDQKMVCQSDDDAALWAKTRGKEWIRANANCMRLLSRDKYAITNDLVIFRHKFLEISGPGINSAQSVQVRYCQTDESHLEAFPDGRLIEFEKRMGGRWDRQGTHITTAPDEGREVDTFYLSGQQDEWHFRCPKCAELFWPLWAGDAMEKYGRKVFVAFAPTDLSRGIVCMCPHCGETYDDTARNRFDLVKDGDYVAMNPSAAQETRSYRWSVFAAHWIAWREMLIESQAAMDAAKLGNLKPLEDFHKKRLCKAWRPILPDFGEGKGRSDYKLGDVWDCGDSIKILSADVQAGKADEGAHIHALCVQYDRNGDSRRLAYRRLDTFEQLHAMAVEFGVQEGKKPSRGVKGQNPHVIVDSGHDNRTVFRACSKYGFYAFRGSDLEQFHTQKQGDRLISYPMPYSMPEPQSGIVGEKQPDKLRNVRGGALPDGWAFCLVGCNPALYGYLLALLGGSSGRYFGIASDMDDCYVKNMPAFVAVSEPDKKTNTVKKVIYKAIRETHWHDMEVQALVIAMRSGYFPLAQTSTQPNP